MEPLDPEQRDAYRFFRRRGYGAQEAHDLVARERAVQALLASNHRVRWLDQGDGLHTVVLERMHGCTHCGWNDAIVVDELRDAKLGEGAGAQESKREYEAMLTV